MGLVGLSGTYVFVPDSEGLRAAFPPPYGIKDWQPIKYVDSCAPPTLLLHGLGDKEVLPQEAIELRDALEKAHVPVQLHLYVHRGHGDTLHLVAPVTGWRTPALRDSVAFLRSVAGNSSLVGLQGLAASVRVTPPEVRRQKNWCHSPPPYKVCSTLEAAAR